jgi:hypothetical protein
MRASAVALPPLGSDTLEAWACQAPQPTSDVHIIVRAKDVVQDAGK